MNRKCWFKFLTPPGQGSNGHGTQSHRLMIASKAEKKDNPIQNLSTTPQVNFKRI